MTARTASSHRIPHSLRVAAGTAAVGLLAAACSSSGSGAPAGGQQSSGGKSGGNPSVVRVVSHTGALGTYLTDGSGRTLYMFASDSAHRSTCTGACVTYWPPLTASGAPAAGGSAKAADLATIARSGGGRQVTYAGHPLYYFSGDSKPGDTTGQGSTNFGASWWVLTPAGTPIRGTSSGSSSSSSGGGYGY